MLLLIMLFNMLGCYGLFLTIWHSNEQALFSSFDDDEYNELETVTIKFPHRISYVIEQPDYQRVDGLFEHEGQFYRFVKQRITSDSIIVVCVKDKKSERINKALSEYVKTFADGPAHDKNAKKISINFSKDYYTIAFTMTTLSPGWETNVLQLSGKSNLICSQYADAVTHPPETA
ncbi:hypothetical protein D770_18990 [Flammeovirgaceae bacterium 311]|nr:hypothetical protein D770_18990 [Flammeovirgaceae bacterium 311]